MRKLAVASATMVALLVVAGVAFASNLYSSQSRVDPVKSGTSSSPTPVKEHLAFQVANSDATKSPAPIQTYNIGLGPGIVPNTSLFPGCSFSVVGASSLSAACKKGIVGGGSVQALITPKGNNARAAGAACYLDVTLVNNPVKKNHLSIRVDSRDGPNVVTAKQCALPGTSGGFNRQPLHFAIDARFVKLASVAGAKGGLLPVYGIVFKVPDFALHPGPGGAYDNSLISDVSDIAKHTTTIKVHRKKVTRGYLESIGCPKTPKNKRTSTVAFADEMGNSASSSSTSNCQS